MPFNFDPLGSVLAAPPLAVAGLGLLGMVLLWMSNKFLKFVQLALAGVVVLCVVRFALGGVGSAEPAALSPAATPTQSVGAAPQSVVAGPAVGSPQVQLDGSGFTVHIPFGGLQGIGGVLKDNASQVQGALDPGASRSDRK